MRLRSLSSSRCHFSTKACGIALERVAPAHHLDPRGQVFRRAHFDRQAEAVEQLRPQLALFRVAAADQHEARRVAHAQAFALDHVLARGGDVEQQVDQVVFEQVDLVDVEKAAMGARQQAGLEGLVALRQRALEIERADDAVFGGAERQVDHRHRSQARSSASAVAPRARGSPRRARRASGSQP